MLDNTIKNTKHDAVFYKKDSQRDPYALEYIKLSVSPIKKQIK